ncbi:MAG: NAD(P)/FAD-dependent oxidoreductase [Cyanobacteria bacterium P01_H01_bin.15]
MNRKEFIKICGIFGLSLPLSSVMKARSKTEIQTSGLSNIIIIGAGAAGLTAGFLLQQQGIEFQILEASPIYGGRMKRTTEFANFPIPLGAEWIHVKPDILEEIVNDDSVDVEVKTTQYNPNVDYALYEDERLSMREIGFREDSKFINSTWFDFFEQYIVPFVEDRIIYNEVVEVIDYSTGAIQVKTQNDVYFADRVVVTVPVKILQNGAISFTPALPNKKQKAIDNVRVWDGCKAFIEFSQKFYPAAVAFKIVPETAGQKLYYDASYGQDTTQHVLGLFAVGAGTKPYVDLSDDMLIEYILNELDELFDGQASLNYVKHIFQNWNTEPYANGAYVVGHENWLRVRTLGKSVDDRLFFAGTAYTKGKDWGSVHTAARSARRAVEEILRS